MIEKLDRDICRDLKIELILSFFVDFKTSKSITINLFKIKNWQVSL